MDKHTTPPRAWLTVDQAFLACQRAGLARTKKTIRSWARNEHVEGQKQTTPTGERWMVEETSLSVKIKAELEFQAQSQGSSEPVQTRANPSEPVQTRTNLGAPRRRRGNSSKPVPRLKTFVASLGHWKSTRLCATGRLIF